MLGVVLIVGSVFVLAFGDAVVKHVSADFSLWQIYVARSVFALPILLALLLRDGRPAAMLPKAPGWVLLRSMLLVMMWIAYYAVLPMISLSVAAVALYTTPLFIALFSALLIGEPVGPRRRLGILVGFAGVLVILRPAADAFSPLTLLPVLAAIFYALAAIITRSRCVEERPLVLSLGLNLCLLGVGLLMSGALRLADPSGSGGSAYPFLLGPWTAMSAREWGIMAFLGVLIVVVSTGVAKAYQSGPPAIIGTFDYSYLVFAALWSFVLFAETPDMATIMGMILIATAGILVAGRSGSRASQPLSAAAPTEL
jgi:drug/metabolite transporter (DMT)-like permease